MRRLLGTICLAFLGTLAMAQIQVTFQVDLRIKAKETLFNPAKDSVTIHGDFMTDAGLGTNWFPGFIVMKDANHDTIYTATVPIDSNKVGTVYNYKFTIDESLWEGDPNRSFTLAKPATVLPVVLFDRDSVLRITAVNTLNFTADLSPYYGTGAGFFDPNTDTLELMGLDWVGATVQGGDRHFVEDPFSPGTFHAQMQIKGYMGDTTKWKCQAFPETKFANSGWEYTNDKWYHIQGDGTVSNVPTFVPDIWPLKAPTHQDVKVLFQVDMKNARNRYLGSVIDPGKLAFVGIKGQDPVLGAWVGDWLPTDTVGASRNLLVLNDKGTNGDKVAGDNIWSALITFPKGNAGGPSLYKYGAFYPGYDTVNSGYHPADNEMLDGFNHFLVLTDVPRIEIFNSFGTTSATVTGVAHQLGAVPGVFSLSQNYPNPFNPTTTIVYSVPTNSHVTLRVFNTIGQEIGMLVNSQQAPGKYSVVLDAHNLASGMYFYRLQAGSNVAIKKLMLLK